MVELLNLKGGWDLGKWDLGFIDRLIPDLWVKEFCF